MFKFMVLFLKVLMISCIIGITLVVIDIVFCNKYDVKSYSLNSNQDYVEDSKNFI